MKLAQTDRFNTNHFFFSVTYFFIFILNIVFASHVYAAEVELGSLRRRSDAEIKRLAKTLSSVTTPKVMVHNEALGGFKFDVGVEQAIYQISSDVRDMFKSKVIGHSDVDNAQYLIFILGRMGLPWGLDSEVAFFLPGLVDKFGVTSVSLKWIPSFLAKDKFFFTPALRQSYTHINFSQYKSDTWTTDLILSTKEIWGIPFYGGGSVIKVYGEYNRGAIRVTQDRKPNMWTGRGFFGVDYQFKIFKKMDLAFAVEAAFMDDSHAYSLKTTLQF